jgi:hypothetical protein
MESNNQDNGLMTKIWGPPMWDSINHVVFGYPNTPSFKQKQYYKIYFLNLGNILPCSLCQKSYNCFISDKNSNTYLSDDIFNNRQTLSLWIFNLHNRVNEKLNVTYVITYDDFIKKYESYRATCDPKFEGCVMQPPDKIQSFKNADKKNCVVIPKSIAKCFDKYASSRGITFDLDKYDELSKTHECSQNKEWDIRNNECTKILKHMRCNGISSIETDGNYIGMPTIDELKLISRLCSSIDRHVLFELVNKLGYNMKRIYKLNIS